MIQALFVMFPGAYRIFRRFTMRRSIIFSVFVFVSMSFMCDLKLDELFRQTNEQIAETTRVLDDAIDKLDGNSRDWQSILQDTVAGLTKDFQSSVRSEVSNLLQRSISTASGEFRCDMDFIGNRARYALAQIKASLIGEELPPLPPELCNIVPLAVDRELVPERLNKVEIFGYDLDAKGLKLYHQSGRNMSDITRFVSKPTHYHLVINMGSNGVRLNDKSNRLVAKWNDDFLSDIAIIQPTTPVCKTKMVTASPGKITYRPPHTRGDREYKGHGPNVTCSVKLLVGRGKIDARISMTARETKKDWTTASGSMRQTVYRPDPGWIITGITNTTSDVIRYIDSNHNEDVFNRPTAGPVKRYVFVGDTKGKEAGTRTQTTVTFNQLRIQLRESKDCVTKKALKQAGKLKRIDPATLRRLRIRLPR